MKLEDMENDDVYDWALKAEVALREAQRFLEYNCAHDNSLNDAELAPDGDDYNEIFGGSPDLLETVTKVLKGIEE